MRSTCRDWHNRLWQETEIKGGSINKRGVGVGVASWKFLGEDDRAADRES